MSFVEDPTRVFRAIRFELRFGFQLSKETLALIKGAVKMELFHRLSGQRLLDELRCVFSERAPRQAVRRLADLDLLRFIHPKLTWSNRLDRRLIEVEEALDWYRLSSLDRTMSRWLVYAMALTEVLPQLAVQDLLARFPVAEAERRAITAARFTTQHICLTTESNVVPLSPIWRRFSLLTGLSDETLVFLLGQECIRIGSSSKLLPISRPTATVETILVRQGPAGVGTETRAVGIDSRSRAD